MEDLVTKLYKWFKKNSDFIGYVIFVLLFVYIHVEIWINLEASIESDMSSELILGKMLAEQKRIITTGWFYSTELRVIQNNLIFPILFMITDNWHVVRIAAIIITNLILFISYYYLAKKLEIKNIPWMGLLMIGSSSRDFYKFVTLGNYYIAHIAIAFVTVGLLIDIFKTNSKTKRIIDIIIFCTLSFVSSLSGPRFLPALHAPLLLTAVLYFFLKQFKNLKEGRIDLKDKRLVYLIVLCFSGLVLSYSASWVNSNILPTLGYSYKMDGGIIRYVDFSFDLLSTVINGFLTVFGYQSDNLYVFSKHQLILKPLFAVFFVIVCWSTAEILINHKKYREDYVLVTLFFVVAMFVMCVMYTITDTWFRNRYLLLVSVFSTFAIGIFLTHYKFDWQKWLMIAFVTMFLIANSVFQIQYHVKYDTYVEFTKVRDILLQNECYGGYAMDHWKGGHNLLTELSDGKIETWRFYGGNLTKIANWLQSKEHLTRKPEGKVYLIVTHEEINNNKIKLKEGIDKYKYYEDELKILYIFDSYEVLDSFV